MRSIVILSIGQAGTEKTVKIEMESSTLIRETQADTDEMQPELSFESGADDKQQGLFEEEEEEETAAKAHGYDGYDAFVSTSSAATESAATVAYVNVKSEEESAVEAIKDVQFGETEKGPKMAHGEKDVPKIVLETAAGEELTEITEETNAKELPRPDSLLPVSSPIGLAPFTSRNSSSFSQFSPTLGSLNPQMLNNSLSNALQTAVTKAEEKIYGRSEDTQDEESKENQTEQESTLDVQTCENASSTASSESMRRKFAFSRDMKNDDIIPSSPDECVALNDALPDSLGLHLFQKKPSATTATCSQSQQQQHEPSNFSSSLFSVSLYNQIRQEQASRLYNGADSVTGDLAEPSDIQKAISQVDVRRHFSPMLLNYLNTGTKGN